jgi:hypothetical protein
MPRLFIKGFQPEPKHQTQPCKLSREQKAGANKTNKQWYPNPLYSSAVALLSRIPHPFPTPIYLLLIAIELLENQMQEKIHVDPDSPIPTPVPPLAKQIHELVVIELRLQQPVERYLGERAGDHHATLRPLDLEDARLVGRDGEFEAVPRGLGVSAPRHQDALLGEVARRVLETAEAVGAPCGLEFAHVVVLACEREEELLLALLRLQRYHGLLDVVVVALELLLEEVRLLVERGECGAYALHLACALHASSVFGADVDCDGVEQVLVVVVWGDAAGALKLDHVLQAVLL